MKNSSKERFLWFAISTMSLVLLTCIILLLCKSCEKKSEENDVLTEVTQGVTTPTIELVVTVGGTPTAEPTSEANPTQTPTEVPTDAPTTIPTDIPAISPSGTPTESVDAPTSTPTQAPANTPTKAPTKAPTATPTKKPTVSSGETPVALHGELSVSGTKLVDENGDVLQLRGVSTHGLQWFPQYVNKATFQTIRDEWSANVIRLAMYTAEGGYCVSDSATKTKLKKLVTDGVEYATELGLYVIIDWHILADGNPNTYKSEAKAFFKEMAQKYKNYDNVLYEICNEPNGGTTWSQIKSYATEIIEVIRTYDDDAIIIVGTPNWSQYVDQAAASPITGSKGKNVMYALHFYANTHRDDLRGKLQSAIQAGLPIFVSEFGIGSADGNGTVNTTEGNKWIALMDKYDVSYVCWNLANKNEATSLIAAGCTKLSGFTANELSAQGKWLVQVLNGTLDDLGSVDIEDVIQDAEQAGGGSSGEEVAAPTAINYSGTSNGCTVQLTSGNTWVTDGYPYYGLSLSITNTSSSEKSNWKLVITFSDTVSTSDFWCVDITTSGSTMTITPQNWNSVISTGGSVSGIGMNLKGNSELTIKSISLTFE